MGAAESEHLTGRKTGEKLKAHQKGPVAG